MFISKTNYATSARRVADIVSLWSLIVLALLFYFPDSDPLESRYMYYADSTERALSFCNPEYNNAFHRYNWEVFSPLSTLTMNVSLRFLHDNPGAAVLAANIGAVVFSIITLYLLSRLFLSIPAAFAVTALMFFGRVLLPLAYGLGQSQIHVLLPVVIAAIYLAPSALRGKEKAKRRRCLVATAACLAVVYVIGNHETMYAAFCAFIAATALAARWILKSIRAKRLMPGPPRPFYSLALATAILCLLFMSMVHFSIPQNQNPTQLAKMITYDFFFKESIIDATSEPFSPVKERWRAIQGAFIHGKYLTEYGKHHEHTFLHPGPGFNGIVPLFLLPGFVLGMIYFVGQSKRPPPGECEDLSAQRKHWFILFLWVLLAFFALTVFASMDPKPTRYTFSIFAVFVVSVWGYERFPEMAARAFARLSGRDNRGQSRGDALLKATKFVSISLMMFFLGAHLLKNYRDLETYESEYAHQIPSAYINPIIDRAIAKAGEKEAAILYFPGPNATQYNTHVSLGIKQNCGVPPNIRFVYSLQEASRLPVSTTIIPIMVDKGLPGELYALPKSKWPSAPVAR